MGARQLTLISHPLCPYVQRAAIVLQEKGIAFERLDIDLGAKPDWFLALSPLGKTPVLVTGGHALFESAVICEFLDETHGPRLHPDDALERARHRGWMEFGSALLNAIAGFYTAADEPALASRARDIRGRLEQLEAVLGEGPFFAGARFSLVDAVFAPVFRYFDVFDACRSIDDLGLFEGLPKLGAWRTRLSARPSVQEAVRADHPQLLKAFVLARGSALSQRMASASTC